MKINVTVIVLAAIMGMSMIAALPVSTTETAVSARGTYNCYFVNPTAGSTLSDTVAIDFYGTYNGAPLYTVKIAVYKDGAALTSLTTMTNLGSNHWGINWDTTGFDDGTGYSLSVRAYRTSRSYKAYTCSNLVVSNGVAPPPPPPPPPGDNVLTSGVTVYSSLTSGNEMWSIEVPASTAAMRSVLNCGSADFDLYGKLGAEPTTSVYDWRGYTSGGEDVTFDLPGAGTWYIMVQVYSGTGNYDLTVTLTAATPPQPWGNGGKYAIIVGISDYASISDLSYCDEDATDWYNYLISMGYECRVYGDGHTANYPRHDGKATEATVRTALQGLAAHAQVGDTVCFVTSGHGSGDGKGSSFLCMWDCSGTVGCYYDTEIAADIGLFAAGVKIQIFIDHCYSGGIGPELMALSIKQYIYCSTTCTENGYGYDDSQHLNGMWTYWFLEAYLVGHPTASMEATFDWASANYPKQPPSGDAPMEFDGNTGSAFYL